MRLRLDDFVRRSSRFCGQDTQACGASPVARCATKHSPAAPAVVQWVFDALHGGLTDIEGTSS